MFEIYLVNFCGERGSVKCDTICFVDADRMGYLWFALCCGMLSGHGEESNHEMSLTMFFAVEFLE